MSHDYYKNCGRGDCGGGCFLCCLAVCKVCGLFEGSLTTDCPGVECYAEKSDAVYAGKIDFVDGEWRDQCSAHSPTAFSDKVCVVTVPR